MERVEYSGALCTHVSEVACKVSGHYCAIYTADRTLMWETARAVSNDLLMSAEWEADCDALDAAFLKQEGWSCASARRKSATSTTLTMPTAELNRLLAECQADEFLYLTSGCNHGDCEAAARESAKRDDLWEREQNRRSEAWGDR